MSKKVDQYINKHPEWEKELQMLRSFLVETDLMEDYKWSLPVYTLNGKNIVGIGATRSHVALWFFHGALLSDPHDVLVNAQKGKTQAMRQWRMEQVLASDKKKILSYVEEAMENQRQGREIKPQRNKPLVVPKMLQAALEKTGLDKKYQELSLSKRRDFAEYISTAKREGTKKRRLEKILPMISDGIGLNDKYVK